MKALPINSLGHLAVRKSAQIRLICMMAGIWLLCVDGAQAQLISSRRPDGLTFSTGNVYFTSHDAAGAAVWRTSQTSVPGQESVLYWEAGARFGDVTFAQINGEFFGYFFAEKDSAITIRRVSLAGGQMRILAPPVENVDIINSHRNLVTDGVNLYWQDFLGVRKMPIGGGPQTVLDQTSPQLPVTAPPASAGIALRGDDVIYAFEKDIRFVPKVGATVTPAVRTIVSASARVTALHAVFNGIYWGERTGAVRLKVGPTMKTLASTAGFTPTSIWSNDVTLGAPVAWTQCGTQSCRVRVESATSSGGSFPVATDAIGVFVGPLGNTFWGDAAGVHRR